MGALHSWLGNDLEHSSDERYLMNILVLLDTILIACNAPCFPLPGHYLLHGTTSRKTAITAFSEPLSEVASTAISMTLSQQIVLLLAVFSLLFNNGCVLSCLRLIPDGEPQDEFLSPMYQAQGCGEVGVLWLERSRTTYTIIVQTNTADC